jgi:hypothetical protein
MFFKCDYSDDDLSYDECQTSFIVTHDTHL